ncbi:MAG: hypothetical protein GY824_18650, partial [Delftia sp.]|nr:hypothetical protein [Delftia sp.]
MISRSYSLAVLCLSVAVVLLTRPTARPLAGVVCLALAAQTTVYAMIIAVAIGAGWGLYHWGDCTGKPRAGAKLVLGAAILFASACLAIWCMRPPPDSSFAAQWHFAPNINRMVSTAQIPWRAFFPVPQLSLHFWNSNILSQMPRVSALLGALLLLAVTWYCRRSIAAMTCWLIGAGGVMAFTYVKY